MSDATRVGPTDDTLQRVLPFVVVDKDPEVLWWCFSVCKSWRQELLARGFCHRTFRVCWALAEGRKIKLGQNALQRLNASTGEAERSSCLEAIAFLQRSWESKGTLHEWLQTASQEPDTSYLSRGAVSTAQILRLPLVQWVGKPQERYPGLCTLTGHSDAVNAVALSVDGKRIVSGAGDKIVKIWDAGTGVEVSEFLGGR